MTGQISPSQIDKFFSAYDRDDAPGCALAVIREGEIIYARGYGLADLERRTPITPASIFDLASSGKQFTALVILSLAQQGLLDLDAPVRLYLPELQACCDPVTTRHMLHHTAGIRDYCSLMPLADMPEQNLYAESALLNLIARQQALIFPPGQEHLYSNSGYFLLGIIARRVSGRSLVELIQDWIFRPLGMQHSTFGDDFGRIVPLRTLAYDPVPGGSFRTNISFCGGFGDGPALSSVEDLFLWDQNFYNNQLCGGGQALIDQMLTPGRLNSGEALDYAAALTIASHRGLKMIRHGGSWAGYRSQFIRFPDQRFSVILLANRSDLPPTELALQVADLHLEQTYTEPVLSLPPESPAEFKLKPAHLAGFYLCERTGALIELNIEGNAIIATFEEQRHKLYPCAERSLRSSPEESPALQLDFPEQDGNIPSAFQAGLTGERAESYLKLPPPPQLDDEQLKQYTGVYRSHEIPVPYRISLVDHALTLTIGYAQPIPLRLISPERFLGQALDLCFERQPQGQITRLRLGSDRMRGIAFEKLS